MTKKTLLNKQAFLILPSTPFEMPEAPCSLLYLPAPESVTYSLRDSSAWFLT